MTSSSEQSSCTISADGPDISVPGTGLVEISDFVSLRYGKQELGALRAVFDFNGVPAEYHVKVANYLLGQRAPVLLCLKRSPAYSLGTSVKQTQVSDLINPAQSPFSKPLLMHTALHSLKWETLIARMMIVMTTRLPTIRNQIKIFCLSVIFDFFG